MLSLSQLQLLMALATEAARQAGRYIAAFDRTQLHVGHKVAGNSLSSQVVTQVDLDSQAIILDVLRPSIEQYDLAVLSEENASEDNVSGHERFRKAYFWCIDPLDGTLPFIEGTDGFAVSIALVEQTGRPVLGVVYNPVTGDIYQALNPLSGAGASLLKNGKTWQPDAELQAGCGHFTLFIDRSFKQDPRYPHCLEQLESLVRQQGYSRLEVVDSCGAVMNAIGVMEKSPACYLKLPKAKKGGGSLWDFAATAALATASGSIMVSDITGRPLDLNRKDSNFMNHRGALYASRGEYDALRLVAARIGLG